MKIFERCSAEKNPGYALALMIFILKNFLIQLSISMHLSLHVLYLHIVTSKVHYNITVIKIVNMTFPTDLANVWLKTNAILNPLSVNISLNQFASHLDYSSISYSRIWLLIGKGRMLRISQRDCLVDIRGQWKNSRTRI